MSGCRWWLLGIVVGGAGYSRWNTEQARQTPASWKPSPGGWVPRAGSRGEAKSVLPVQYRREISLRGLRFVVADAAGDEGVREHGGAPQAADEDRDAEGNDGETGAAGFAGVEDLVDGG